MYNLPKLVHERLRVKFIGNYVMLKPVLLVALSHTLPSFRSIHVLESKPCYLVPWFMWLTSMLCFLFFISRCFALSGLRSTCFYGSVQRCIVF